MTTRRRFIEIVPLAGLTLLAACSDKPAPPAIPSPAPSPAPSPTPSPPPAPSAAPVAQAPAAAATTPVDPAEPAAMALGYVIDATKVDGAKFKTYSAGQLCSNCALFGAKAGEAAGPCPLFGGRPVAAKGWCSGYIKKAA